MSFNIPLVLGTGREGRATEHAAKFVFEQAKAFGFDTQLLDARDFVTHTTTGRFSKERPDDAVAKKWSDIMKAADGLIIVSPEYNHGYPGELKLMLDILYDEYKHKPLAIIGAGGTLGGGRMVEQLRLVAIELQMVPIRNAVYFFQVYNAFNEDGTIKDPSYADRLQPVFEELAWYAEALRTARIQELI
jgi:NAD(P)H-dependent FMN reductase